MLDGPRVDAVVVGQRRLAEGVEPSRVPRLEQGLLPAEPDEVRRTVPPHRHERRQDVAGLHEAVGQGLPQERLRGPGVTEVEPRSPERQSRAGPLPRARSLADR